MLSLEAGYPTCCSPRCCLLKRPEGPARMDTLGTGSGELPASQTSCPLESVGDFFHGRSSCLTTAFSFPEGTARGNRMPWAVDTVPSAGIQGVYGYLSHNVV